MRRVRANQLPAFSVAVLDFVGAPVKLEIPSEFVPMAYDRSIWQRDQMRPNEREAGSSTWKCFLTSLSIRCQGPFHVHSITEPDARTKSSPCC